MKKVVTGFVSITLLLVLLVGIFFLSVFYIVVKEAIEELNGAMREIPIINIFTYDPDTEKYEIETYFQDKKVIKLCKAAKEGDTKKIDKLLAKGANINVIGKDGMTPLYWLFVINNRPENSKKGIQHLLEKGANPTIIYEKNYPWTVLHEAASHKDPWYLQTILKNYSGNIDIDLKGSERTPLLRTSIRYENFKILLAHGASIDWRSDSGESLFSAIGSDWRRILLLLEYGADYNERSVDIRSEKLKEKPDVLYFLEEDDYRPSWGTNRYRFDHRQKVIEFLRGKGVKINPWMPEDEEYRYEDGVAVLYIREESGVWVKFAESSRYDPSKYYGEDQEYRYEEDGRFLYIRKKNGEWVRFVNLSKEDQEKWWKEGL